MNAEEFQHLDIDCISVSLPNLDGLADYEDMRAFGRELDQVASAMALLSAYATNKAHAMAFRQDGDIPRAREHEAVCDGIYKRLPEWARW